MSQDSSLDNAFQKEKATLLPEVDNSDEEYSDALVIVTNTPIYFYRRNRRSLSEGNLFSLDYGEDLGEDNKWMQPTRRDGEGCEDAATKWLHKSSMPARPSQFIASFDNLPQHQKFISTAEAVYKFHRDTPERFRSQPRLATFHSNPAMAHLKVTVPYSPKLRTKIRTRPCHVMTQEEREQMEFEEIQKIKFKAKPPTKNLHKPPKSVPIERKQVTKPEPFKLTNPPPKKVIQKEEFVFQALPIPRTSYRPPLLPGVEKRPLTTPKTPNLMKNYKPRERGAEKKVLVPSTIDATTATVPVPFSFENRDNMRVRKREQLIKKMRDEEKKAREFHATPFPRSLYERGSTSNNSESSAASSSGRCPSTDNICAQFKAREATVLKKNPFVPSVSKRPAIKVVPFQLETESRRVEREEFDKKIRMREEILELQREHIKAMEAEEEQEERERYRKLAEYRANPIKKYKPVQIQSSRRVTHPVTPLLTNQKKSGKDKENVGVQNK